jgi:hypothetical protein
MADDTPPEMQRRLGLAADTGASSGGRYGQRAFLGRNGSDGPLRVRRELSGERVRIFDRGRRRSELDRHSGVRRGRQ